MSASFTKDERLHSFKEIQSLMKNGESFFLYPFKVIYQNIALERENDMRPNAIIASVPKRHFKRAVKRNLIKRRIRESYRLNKGTLSAPQGCRTNVLFVYISKEVKDSKYIESRLKEILLHISQENSKGDTDNGD